MTVVTGKRSFSYYAVFLNKLPPDIVPRQAGAVLEEQITLFSFHIDGVPAALPVGAHRRDLTDVFHYVDFIRTADSPSQVYTAFIYRFSESNSISGSSLCSIFTVSIRSANCTIALSRICVNS